MLGTVIRVPKKLKKVMGFNPILSGICSLRENKITPKMIKYMNEIVKEAFRILLNEIIKTTKVP